MNTVCSVPIAFACFVVHMILSYIPIVIKNYRQYSYNVRTEYYILRVPVSVSVSVSV